MRGAGCTINDMWDRDYDKKVVSSWKGIGRFLSILQSNMAASLLKATESKGFFSVLQCTSLTSAIFQLNGRCCKVQCTSFLDAIGHAGCVLHFYKMNYSLEGQGKDVRSKVKSTS